MLSLLLSDIADEERTDSGRDDSERRASKTERLPASKPTVDVVAIPRLRGGASGGIFGIGGCGGIGGS